jgi:hypothetical protein
MQITIYNTRTGEASEAEFSQAQNTVRISRGEWSFDPPLPEGWDTEIPQYRVQMDLLPAMKERHRTEKPFSVQAEGNVWQYSEPHREHRVGEIIETTAWPHPSMFPLNHSARAIHTHFVTKQRSRMNASPWLNGRVHLDDGTSFEKSPPPVNRDIGGRAIGHQPPEPAMLRPPRGTRPRVA